MKAINCPTKNKRNRGDSKMDSEDRRTKIINILNNMNEPIKGMVLAEKLNVSKQIIVQDIALLRAKGENIISTPQGYIILKGEKSNKIVKTIVCKHEGNHAIEDELNSIVDMGGEILDVIVEHPIYGEIKSPLMIGSRLEVANFMENLRKTNAEPLSSLTDGVHIHSIQVDNEDVFEKIKKILDQKGYLIK